MSQEGDSAQLYSDQEDVGAPEEPTWRTLLGVVVGAFCGFLLGLFSIFYLWDPEWQVLWGLIAPYGWDSFPGVFYCFSPLILPFPGAILGAILVKYLVKYLSEK